MKRSTVSSLLAAVAAIVFAGPVLAADHQVQMLNKGEKGAMVFQPDYIEAAPGDTVTFIPTDKGHDAESIKAMIPAGAEPFKGKINQEVTVTLDKEGLYGVKCTPHFGMGMVALIKVGAPTNADAVAAVKLPGKAKAKMSELLARAK
ncbi:pseudoazurin [Tianweitania sp. BSSL-BM11]|uniref:Pseudoazurin n=1 Tax=Tianweitania aestuarii TaxID=2814886 RepID=A0ABS5RX09_9HYPH|nr:pseudoazurin [Tianweitania aestuarii]MBS9721573.1 pseudoazurin [Tianweitania aestuarii]